MQSTGTHLPAYLPVSPCEDGTARYPLRSLGGASPRRSARMRFDHPDDHPDDRSGSVWSRLDRRATQREQARSALSRPV